MGILFYTIASLFMIGWAVAILGFQAGFPAHLLLLGTVIAMASRFTYKHYLANNIATQPDK